MQLLLDTQLLLWAATETRKVPRKARALLEDAESILHFSVASLWEVAIKNSLGREDFDVNLSRLRRALLDNGWQELPVTGSHALAVEKLPSLHKDPFDRMLLAQAQTEGLLLLTTDKSLAQYQQGVRLV